MKIITATQARQRLYSLLGEAAQSHEPIQIKGKKGSAVLISAENWWAIQETLHLLSVPGMRESIMDGLKTPVSECQEELDW